MSDSVGRYLNEIGTVPLLSADEERELSKAIEAGKRATRKLARGDQTIEVARAIEAAAVAKDRFFQANRRLVVSVARRYPLPPSMELLDLIQEGNLGLEHAVDKFDWRKGFKFSTYATFWIRQAIGRALDQKASLVRLPGDRSASLRAALRQVSGDGDELNEEHVRLHRLTTPTSLDRTIGDDVNELVDLLPNAIPGSDQVIGEAEETLITSLLNVLDTRARYAVEQRFGLVDCRKRTYREVGEDLGVTAEAARRLLKRAVTAVRNEAALEMIDKIAVGAAPGAGLVTWSSGSSGGQGGSSTTSIDRIDLRESPRPINLRVDAQELCRDALAADWPDAGIDVVEAAASALRFFILRRVRSDHFDGRGALTMGRALAEILSSAQADNGDKRRTD